MAEFACSAHLDGVIPSEAVFQAERGIWRAADAARARSFAPLVKARGFGMTPHEYTGLKLSPYWSMRSVLEG